MSCPRCGAAVLLDVVHERARTDPTRVGWNVDAMRRCLNGHTQPMHSYVMPHRARQVGFRDPRTPREARCSRCGAAFLRDRSRRKFCDPCRTHTHTLERRRDERRRA